MLSNTASRLAFINRLHIIIGKIQVETELCEKKAKLTNVQVRFLLALVQEKKPRNITYWATKLQTTEEDCEKMLKQLGRNIQLRTPSCDKIDIQPPCVHLTVKGTAMLRKLFFNMANCKFLQLLDEKALSLMDSLTKKWVQLSTKKRKRRPNRK